MTHKFPRRDLLTTAAGATLAGFALTHAARADEPASRQATRRRALLPQLQHGARAQAVARREDRPGGRAGYDAIEPWLGDLHQYVEGGGSADDLRKRIADRGLTVESAIGFAKWIVDDDAERAKGLEDARRNMDLIRRIGGKRIAAPPAAAHGEPRLDLLRAAERYRALLEVGQQIGVIAQLEVWGFSKNLSRLGETAFVAIESGHPWATVLPDVYHLYKGGSDFEGLALLSGNAINVFHMNDYPNEPSRAAIADAHRVYPGDGVAPLSRILQTPLRQRLLRRALARALQ